MSEIYLRDLLASNQATDLLAASKRLVREPNTKLNCTGVSNLSRKQFKQLFSQIPAKNIRTEINYYLNIDTIDEELLGILATYIESNLVEIKPKYPPIKNIALTIVIGILTSGIIVSNLYYQQNQQATITNNKVGHSKTHQYKLKTKSLTIGILGDVEKYEPLISYLESKLNKRVKITLDGYENIPERLASDRIQLKQWDLVFAPSATVSLAAEDNNYHPIARIYPDRPPYYQSVLFVRKDSQIESMDNITPATKIALGNDDSASSFYLPLYYLYGEKLHIYRNYRASKIKEMVKNGRVDIGVGIWNETIEKKDLDNNFRIILQTMDIPRGRVYLSPSLAKKDSQILTTLLNNAPQTVTNKDKANYGDSNTPIDYTDYREVIKSVEQTITCADFTVNPVNLYCPPRLQYLELIGKVQDWKSKNNRYSLTIVDRDRHKHKVYLDKKIAIEIVGQDNPIYLKNKKVKIKYVPLKSDRHIVIKNPLQLKILPQ